MAAGSFMVSCFYHNLLVHSARVLVRVSVSPSQSPASLALSSQQFSGFVSHGSGRWPLVSFFSSLQEAQAHVAFVRRVNARLHARLPQSYLRAVLAFYSDWVQLCEGDGQLSLF